MATKDDQIRSLLERASSLTGIVRTSWTGVILGCLYVLLTLAALDDLEFFAPKQQLVLPIVGTPISANGFFLFAPFLLLAAYLYMHLMLAELFKCYAGLCAASAEDGHQIDGVAVRDRVQPWFMTTLIPEAGGSVLSVRSFFAHALCWFVAPITILAIGWRYLAAHEYILTAYHCVLLAIAIVSIAVFEAYRSYLFAEALNATRRRRPQRRRIAVTVLAASAALSVLLFWGAWSLTRSEWSLRLPQTLTPHADLARAELSRRPSNWNQIAWIRVKSSISDLQKSYNDIELKLLKSARCNDLSDDTKITEECKETKNLLEQLKSTESKLEEMLEERDFMLNSIEKAEFGQVPAPFASVESEHDIVVKTPAARESYCKDQKNLLVDERDLSFSNLRRADLTNGTLKCSVFFRADMEEAKLYGVDLRFADLRRADLSRAELVDAKLNSADLTGANLNDAKLDGASLESAFSECSSAGGCITMQDASFYNARLKGAVLPGADLRDADLRNVELHDARLFGADLTKSKLDGAKLNGVNLAGAKLAGTTTYGAQFVGANLNKATTADSDNEIGELNLVDADLKWAVLKDVDLTKSGVTKDQIARAFGDRSVLLPTGIEMPPHWSDEVLEESEFFGRWHAWATYCGDVEATNRLESWGVALEKVDWEKPRDKSVCPGEGKGPDFPVVSGLPLPPTGKVNADNASERRD